MVTQNVRGVPDLGVWFIPLRGWLDSEPPHVLKLQAHVLNFGNASEDQW